MGLLDVIDGTVTPAPSVTTTPGNVISSNTFEGVLREFDVPNHIGRGVVPLLQNMYQTLGVENQDLFGEVLGKLSGAQNTEELQRYFVELNTIYQRYVLENAAEIDRSRKAIVSAELVDETDILSDPFDSIFGERIMDKYNDAEALWDTAESPASAENQLLARIKTESFSGTIDKSDIDTYFADILSNDSLNSTQQAKLEQEIQEFKQNSNFYKQLEQGESIDLGSINSYLDTQAAKAINMPESGNFEMEIEGEPFVFHSKKEFLLAIYELKVQLAEMGPGFIYRAIVGTWNTITHPLSLTLGGGLLAYFAIRGGWGYFKSSLQAVGDIINQGIKQPDLERMSNATRTGTLDATIKMYQDAGFNAKQIAPLLRLQKDISQMTIDWGTGSDVLKAQSRVYRSLARFRGRFGFYISNIASIGDPIDAENKPFRSIPKLVIGSINKGPEGSLAGWQWQTQREAINKYIDGFGKFNTVVENIDTILKNPPHSLSDDLRREVKREVLGVYIDRSWPLVRGSRVRPFRNRFKSVEAIIQKHTSVGGDLETFIRMLKGDIAPEIKSLLPDIESRIKRLPEISDSAEKSFLTKLREFQHLKSRGDFLMRLNTELTALGISGATNHGDLLRIVIKDSEIYNTDNIDTIRKNIRTDITNYDKITQYLNATTEGHRGLIIYNIARIIGGDVPVKTLSLDASREALKASGLAGMSLEQLGRAVHGKRIDIIDAVAKVGSTTPAAGAPAKPSAGTTPTSAPAENIDTIREKARAFADRIVLEAALNEETNLFQDEGFLREVHKRIRNHTNIDSMNLENETLQIVRDLVGERGGDISKIARDVGGVRILTSIQTDLQTRAIAGGATADMQLRITEGFKNTSSLRRLFREEMRPGRLLKFLL